MEEPNERMRYGRTFGTAMGDGALGQGRRGSRLRRRLRRARSTSSRPRSSARASRRRPTVVCVKTDRDANLAVPEELGLRFVEVYQGPLG